MRLYKCVAQLTVVEKDGVVAGNWFHVCTIHRRAVMRNPRPACLACTLQGGDQAGWLYGGLVLSWPADADNRFDGLW